MVRQNHFQIEDIVKQPMGKRKRTFQIEDIHDICVYLPVFTKNSQNTMVRQNHFQIENIVKQQKGKRKRPFQIEDIHDMCVYLHIFTHNSEKTRRCDKTIFK